MVSHKSNKHDNKVSKIGLAERDLKLLQLEEEIKRKKEFLLEKRLELEKNEDLNQFLKVVKKDYNKYYEKEVNQKKRELQAMTILNDYIHFLEDEKHLVNNQLISAKHDKKEIMYEINKIKKELQKITDTKP
jgi:hypothetical protein